ncbi:MAG: hypothetical protein GWP05_05135 [Anaerolineaceae bacterium]|nr:hypothetical protein [Anaerolineaceae bacterium]
MTTQEFTLSDGSTVAGEELDMASRLCLSCHDGQTAVDSYGGNQGYEMITGSANIGTDLRNDHPIGVDYPTDNNRYKPTPNLPLFGVGGTVECSTCHDPHENANGSFLRLSNSGSAMCLECHDY